MIFAPYAEDKRTFLAENVLQSVTILLRHFLWQTILQSGGEQEKNVLKTATVQCFILMWENKPSPDVYSQLHM